MNLDFARVCGKHNLVYEAYYKQVTRPLEFRLWAICNPSY